MGRVDTALRRAAMDGALKRLVTEIDTEPTVSRRDYHPDTESAPPKEKRPRKLHWPGDASPRRVLEPQLPPDVLSQLSNLVEAVTVHPAAPRILAFTSPGRGEGTSTCLATVGAYLASRHARVLMVDANQHHPALHVIANIEACPGLAELVTGEIDLQAAVTPTVMPDLFLLTNGKPDGGNPSSVLPPSAVHDCVIQYATIFDFVLVDCAPINVYADAAGIAGSCDAVILVIDGNRTRREAAQSSKALLTRANCSVLGVFMNKRKFYIPAFLYNRL